VSLGYGRKTSRVAVPIPDIDTLIRTKQTDRVRDEADVEELERIKALTQR